jgi:signal transduction histidine kinase
MLYQFLTANREELIDRCRKKVEKRSAPRPTEPELQHGIPLFLSQLTRVLLFEQTASQAEARILAQPEEPSKTAATSDLGKTASSHGKELLRQGFTVDQVVHDYGDLCQAITELAGEQQAPIAADEFRALNLCLDNAIAGAVTEFARQREQAITEQNHSVANERLGFLAHELRNLLNLSMLAVAAVKRGNVGLSGATGAVLDRSLIGMRDLIDRSLLDVRLTAGIPVRPERFSLSDFIEEVQVSAVLEAQVRSIDLTVAPVAQGIWVDADPHMLTSAVGNLLQNAFKFTKRHSHVALTAYATSDRVLIDIADECGGLPPGKVEELFQPFEQRSEDRSGLGLGLSLCRRSIAANGGALSVGNLPGRGCVFTIDLPRAQ